MPTRMRIWFGLGASALVLGVGEAREPTTWLPELVGSAHAQASPECPAGSTAAGCGQGGEAGEDGTGGQDEDGQDGQDG